MCRLQAHTELDLSGIHHDGSHSFQRRHHRNLAVPVEISSKSILVRSIFQKSGFVYSKVESLAARLTCTGLLTIYMQFYVGTE